MNNTRVEADEIEALQKTNAARSAACEAVTPKTPSEAMAYLFDGVDISLSSSGAEVNLNNAKQVESIRFTHLWQANEATLQELGFTLDKNNDYRLDLTPPGALEALVNKVTKHIYDKSVGEINDLAAFPGQWMGSRASDINRNLDSRRKKLLDAREAARALGFPQDNAMNIAVSMLERLREQLGQSLFASNPKERGMPVNAAKSRG